MPKADPEFENTVPDARAPDAATQTRRDAIEASMASLSPRITDPLAQQAAAMMVEDVRAYIQGFEQVSLAASAQAMILTLRDPSAGEAALKAIHEHQKDVLSFAKEAADLATHIRATFRKKL